MYCICTAYKSNAILFTDGLLGAYFSFWDSASVKQKSRGIMQSCSRLSGYRPADQNHTNLLNWWRVCRKVSSFKRETFVPNALFRRNMDVPCTFIIKSEDTASSHIKQKLKGLYRLPFLKNPNDIHTPWKYLSDMTSESDLLHERLFLLDFFPSLKAKRWSVCKDPAPVFLSVLQSSTMTPLYI